MRWAIVLLIVALGGCLGGGGGDASDRGGDPGPDADAPPEPAGPDPPTPDPDVPRAPVPLLTGFRYDGCSGLGVRLQPPLQAAQDALPEGYVPAKVTGFVQTRADIEYIFVRCDGFSTGSSSFEATMFGHLAVRIEAPAGAASADEHWYRLLMFAEPGLMSAVWTQAGYDVVTANLTRPETPVANALAFGGYETTGLATSPAPADAVAQAVVTESAAGVLEWNGTFAAQADAMQATFTPADDDPFAAAWDDPLVPATYTWFTDAQWTGIDLWLIR